MALKNLLATVLSVGLLTAVAAVSAETKRERMQEERIQALESMVAELQEAIAQLRGKKTESDEGDPKVKASGGGLSVKEDDGSSFKLGGRILLDYDSYDGIFYDGGATDESVSDSEWRRVRVTASGKLQEDWAYKMTINFDDQDETVDVNTAYIDYKAKKQLFRLGKFKEPFLLERLTSSKWISAIERSLLVDALEGSCQGAEGLPDGDAQIGLKNKCLGAGQPDLGGFQLSGYDENANHFNWAIGIFDDGVEDSVGDDNYAVTARLAIAPHFDDDHFLHLGLGYSARDLEGLSYTVESRLGVHTGSKTALGSSNSIEDVSQYALEAAYVYGPYSLQAEYLDVSMDGNTIPTADPQLDDIVENDLDFDGYYIQAAYTLTGETRGYKTNGAVFDKIKPNSSKGAWEAVARFESLDVEESISGGGSSDAEAEKWLLGLNWYANAKVKFMANYLNSEAKGLELVEDDGDAFSLRAQYLW